MSRFGTHVFLFIMLRKKITIAVKTKFFLLLFALLAHLVTTFAQKNNYTGTWVLNFAKSKLEHRPNGLISTVFVIKQTGDKFCLTRYHIFEDKKKKIRFKMVADGKTRRIKLLFKGKLEWKEGSLLSTLWRKNFLNIVKYKFGDNQNEFIADEVFTGRPQNHHNIWVFAREIPK
jgi:hypothetical protein